MKMATSKETKQKKIVKKKRNVNIIMLIIMLFTLLTGLFNFLASNKSNELTQKSIDMNTYLLGSFTDRLRSFNSELELLLDMCNNKYNQSLLLNYNNEIYQGDTEFTINKLRDFGALDCESSLNMLQHDFRESSILKLNESVNLNIEISQEKNRKNIFEVFSYIFTILTIVFIFIGIRREKDKYLYKSNK